MYNMNVQGTVNQKLIDYVERVYNYLGLDEYEDCLFDLEFVPRCDANAGGFCNGDEELVIVELARSDAVGRIPMQDLMVNIAHELVHAQQLASGRLVNKGFVFRTNEEGEQILTLSQVFDGVEYTGVKYKDQPWEIEAYAKEKEIYEACK